MMRTPAVVACITLMLAICSLPQRSLAGDAPTAGPLPAPIAHSPAAALLARPATLRGKIGAQPIEMHLQMKVPADEGIEGDYLLTGQTHKILLAGESENDNLSLEESENGSDISGLWDGVIDGRTIRGTWTSADGSVVKPFELSVAPAAALVGKSSPSRKRLKLATHTAPSLR